MKNLLIVSIALTFALTCSVAALASSAKGQGVYMNFCAPCHAGGIAGAPKTGDKANWQKRIEKGETAIINNAIKGYQGEAGYMPAKGGNSALTDEEVSAAVMYMLEQSQ